MDKDQNTNEVESTDVYEDNDKTTTSTSTVKVERKRRLSKKERKALKKQKKHNGGATSASIECTDTSTDKPINKSCSLNTASCAVNDNENEEEQERIYLKSYKAIPIPTTPSAEILANNDNLNSNAKTDSRYDDHGEGGDARSKTTLGKWFPNALLIKSSVSYTNTGRLILSSNTSSGNTNKESINPNKSSTRNPRSSLLLFYQYASPKWSKKKLQLFITYLSIVARKRNLGGRIRVASEGVNVTVSAVDLYYGDVEDNNPSTISEEDDTIETSAAETLRHFAQDLRTFDSKIFSKTDFKYIDDLPPDRHFKECKILPVQELVYYGIREDDAPLDEEGGSGGMHLDAKEYHEMLAKDGTVVIDVRNHYENILGRFDGQMLSKKKDGGSSNDSIKGKDSSRTLSSVGGVGAEYIDPLMRKSTDFPDWLAKEETKEKLRGKNVLMYCTGGVRCERASAYLKKKIGDEVKGVYQLKGGVERYLKAFPDGGFWRGKNFVFDKREAVGIDNIHGDGGVVRIDKKNKKRNNVDIDKDLLSKCCVCGDNWDRYVGKKKCYTCGVPVLMCIKCMSKKPDKTPGMELSVRCPLCVAENVTVPADEVEFTANGIKGKLPSQCKEEVDKSKEKTSEMAKSGILRQDKNNVEAKRKDQDRKAANSVLKWGGGHATKKKDMRKMKRRLCQFGSECIRKDCYFAHPERSATST